MYPGDRFGHQIQRINDGTAAYSSPKAERFSGQGQQDMTAKRVLIAIGVVLASFVAYGLIWSPRPSQSEKDTVAVLRAADQFTLEEVADAWAQRKLGNTEPMEEILKAFPFPPREVREEEAHIILTFEAHNETCIHFRINPAQRSSNTFARPC